MKGLGGCKELCVGKTCEISRSERCKDGGLKRSAGQEDLRNEKIRRLDDLQDKKISRMRMR